MKYTWTKTGDSLADNLGAQLQKIVRQMNRNQFKTRYRYVQANQRFVKFIAKEFRVQRLANIKDRHLEKYTSHLISSGKTHKYIKTELSAIRFLHNSMPNTKFELCDATVFNRRMNLSKTSGASIDRAWTEAEIRGMKDYFLAKEDRLICHIIDGITVSGMRLEEICTLRTRVVKEALKTGYLHLTNTKGGVPRDVPVTLAMERVFIRAMADSDGGSYLFTPKLYEDNRQVHKFKKSVQNKLYYHRKRIQDRDRQPSAHNVTNGSRAALSVHGLRHTYARDHYQALKRLGKSEEEARLTTARHLGHGRASVTKIYLAGKEG